MKSGTWLLHHTYKMQLKPDETCGERRGGGTNNFSWSVLECEGEVKGTKEDVTNPDN